MVRSTFPLTPKGMIDHLKLRRPMYRKTAAFGHFGRTEDTFTWEAIDKAEALRAEATVAARHTSFISRAGRKRPGALPRINNCIVAHDVSTETCKRETEITVPLEEVEKETEHVIGEHPEKGELPGFRPGKAPASLIRTSSRRRSVRTCSNTFCRMFSPEATKPNSGKWSELPM